MYRPKRKIFLFTATILVIISVAFISVSAVSISGSSSSSSISLAPSSSFNLSREAYSGYLLEYSVTATPSNHNMEVYAVSPSGSVVQNRYYNDTNGGSAVFIASGSGSWELVVTNTGNSSMTVHASFGAINQYFVYIAVLGIIFLISGLTLFAVYIHSKVQQKRREKFRDFSQ